MPDTIQPLLEDQPLTLEMDPDWEDLWLAELDRRVELARSTGDSGSPWPEARTRILERLRSK